MKPQLLFLFLLGFIFMTICFLLAVFIPPPEPIRIVLFRGIGKPMIIEFPLAEMSLKLFWLMTAYLILAFMVPYLFQLLEKD